MQIIDKEILMQKGKEFIWYQDHFAYHITEKQNIDSIIKNGLIPSIGNRSRVAGDEFKAIYFFDEIYSLEEWMDFLYQNQDKDSLEILRFNIKNLKWYFHRKNEFYITQIIPSEKIDFLILYRGLELVTFSEIQTENIFNFDYRWNKLKEYHKTRNS